MFSDQKKVEGNKSNRSLGPEYLTSLHLSHPYSPMHLPWPSWGPASHTWAAAALCCLLSLPSSHFPTHMQTSLHSAVIRHRPNRAPPPGRETGTGKSHLSNTWALQLMSECGPWRKWKGQLSLLSPLRGSVSTGLWHAFVLFKHQGPPRQADYSSLTCLPDTALCSRARGKPLCWADWDMKCHC